MRWRQRPDQFPLPNIAVNVPTAYGLLREMQVWTGERQKDVYVAHRTRRNWFLVSRFSAGTQYLVKQDGSLWGYDDRAYDRRSLSTLGDFVPTGGTATRCGCCMCISLPGENRHSRDCPYHPLNA